MFADVFDSLFCIHYLNYARMPFTPTLPRQVHLSTRGAPNEEHPAKALSSRLVRLAGSSIDVNEVQPKKALSPRLVMPAGSSMDVNEEQP